MARKPTSVAPAQPAQGPVHGRQASSARARASGKERKTEPWSALLDEGRADERLVREAREGPGRARLVDVPRTLHPEVLTALASLGIERLYSHQTQAVQAATEGPTIVTTGTASGKSLCFNLPTLHILCEQSRARALYLYPTKALAQDQARALNAFGLTRKVRPAIYDGDTPRESRADIRRDANVVLTNPDMLHVGILPNHAAWAELFANLAVVVVDEAHVYRGVFGSHVAGVLRRLRRIAAIYGTYPIFLLTSATIANPVELAERLTGLEDIALIDDDGSPTPGRRIAMWNPPLTDAALGARRSALGEAAELLARLVREGARAICFMKSRKGVELLSRLVTQELETGGHPELAERVAPYRAGYTPQQRRELEGRLTRGELRAVITTDALELGIDIGELDAAVVVTFPGTVASLRQMWGRAGRRGRGLAVYVAGEDALDQFFCRHPDEFLDRPVEAAILDHESPLIFAAHLLCAAHEGPLDAQDAEFFGPRLQAQAELLVSAGRLRARPARGTDGGEAVGRETYVPRNPGFYPAAEVSLRSASPDTFAIVDVSSGELLGQTEAARAHSTVHDGAIYLHQGRSYEVRDLDLDHRRALVAPFEGDWYTQPKRETMTQIERLLDRRDTLRVTLSFGEVSVTETVLAYQRRRLSDHAQIDLVALDLPETSFSTQALWFELDSAQLRDEPATVAKAGPRVGGGSVAEGEPAAAGQLTEIVPLASLLGALHATEHAQIAVLPLIAMCDRWDIGGLSTNLHPQTGRPTIFLYDGHPGGIGIARTAFQRFEELCADAQRLIAGCGCADGCPSCVQSPKCGNLNEPLSKTGARLLLERMLAAPARPAAERRSDRDAALLNT
ncbi:MAG TPA: DEAD/DEAH box helicase [Solirubrobacteraceae bacterium]|nr:DEAD/DEAH box helicase [Solirubrobacteraceae bacterium]